MPNARVAGSQLRPFLKGDGPSGGAPNGLRFAAQAVPRYWLSKGFSVRVGGSIDRDGASAGGSGGQGRRT
jgi:hypothetical protein